MCHPALHQHAEHTYTESENYQFTCYLLWRMLDWMYEYQIYSYTILVLVFTSQHVLMLHILRGKCLQNNYITHYTAVIKFN